MIKFIMHGCNGKMGQVITKLVKEDSQAEIVAGIDKYMGIKMITLYLTVLVNVMCRQMLSLIFQMHRLWMNCWIFVKKSICRLYFARQACLKHNWRV